MFTVKHLGELSQQRPIVANAFQEIICLANDTLVNLLGNLGGAAPIKQFVSDKCDLPPTT